MDARVLSDKVPPLLKEDNNFDIIRYYLSLAVVLAHFSELSQTPRINFTSSYTAVGGFFILSGFLVFYSFLRQPDLKAYIARRVKRIFPPYMFIVVLCAFAGVFVSDYSFKEYFTSSQLYKYLAANCCFLNFLAPDLPGVFTGNHVKVVNGSLWTMKVELMLYASVPLVYWLFKMYNKLAVLIGIYVLSLVYRIVLGYMYNNSHNEIYMIFQRQVFGQFLFFYSGVFVLFYFDYFQQYIRYIFPAALLLVITGGYNPVYTYIQPACLACVILGFAYNCRWFVWMRKYDNIAYDIYLFHFPIIQLVVSLGLVRYNYWLALAVILILTIGLSLFSWNRIEKPVLKSRHH